MLIIGIIFIGISFTLANKLDNILVEIIATVGSFAIWTTAESWLLDSKIIKLKKYKFKKFSESKTVFQINEN